MTREQKEKEQKELKEKQTIPVPPPVEMPAQATEENKGKVEEEEKNPVDTANPGKKPLQQPETTADKKAPSPLEELAASMQKIAEDLNYLLPDTIDPGKEKLKRGFSNMGEGIKEGFKELKNRWKGEDLGSKQKRRLEEALKNTRKAQEAQKEDPLQQPETQFVAQEPSAPLAAVPEPSAPQQETQVESNPDSVVTATQEEEPVFMQAPPSTVGVDAIELQELPKMPEDKPAEKQKTDMKADVKAEKQDEAKPKSDSELSENEEEEEEVQNAEEEQANADDSEPEENISKTL